MPTTGRTVTATSTERSSHPEISAYTVVGTVEVRKLFDNSGDGNPRVEMTLNTWMETQLTDGGLSSKGGTYDISRNRCRPPLERRRAVRRENSLNRTGNVGGS